MTERERALTAAILERTVLHLDRLDRQARRRPWEVATAFGVGIALGMWSGVALALSLIR